MENNQVTGRGRRIIADAVILGAVLLFALIAFLIYNFALPHGGYVDVVVNGEVVASYPLDEDITLELAPGDGYSNVLVIKDGKASISEANCPDGICAAHAPVDKDGQTVVCLPHRLVVAVRGKD